MSTPKTLGIRINSIIFPHVVFNRSVTIQSSEIDPQISVNATVDESNNILYVELKIIIQNEEKTLNIEVICIGQFQEDSETPTISLQEFSKKDAPAILFPYVREYISSLTSKSGIAPILLPPINFHTVTLKTENTPSKKRKSTSAKKSTRKK